MKNNEIRGNSPFSPLQNLCTSLNIIRLTQINEWSTPINPLLSHLIKQVLAQVAIKVQKV